MKKIVYKCEACSGEVNDSAKFCNHCGSQFDKFMGVTVDKEKMTIKFSNYADLKKVESSLPKSANDLWKRKGEDTLVFSQWAAFKSAQEVINK